MGSCSSNKRKHSLAPIEEAPLNALEIHPINAQAPQLVPWPALQIEEEINKLTRISLTECIGVGANAKVYRYQLLNYGMALKCYRNKEDAEEESSVLEKIKQLSKDCPGIVPYYGMKKLLIDMPGQIPFEGFILFFEECEQDLRNLTESGNALENADVFDFINQICMALIYLHTNNCYHRDLKPANIMVNKKEDKFQFYLTDFSESKILSEQMITNHKTLSQHLVITFVLRCERNSILFPT